MVLYHFNVGIFSNITKILLALTVDQICFFVTAVDTQYFVLFICFFLFTAVYSMFIPRKTFTKAETVGCIKLDKHT